MRQRRSEQAGAVARRDDDDMGGQPERRVEHGLQGLQRVALAREAEGKQMQRDAQKRGHEKAALRAEKFCAKKGEKDGGKTGEEDGFEQGADGWAHQNQNAQHNGRAVQAPTRPGETLRPNIFVQHCAG